MFTKLLPHDKAMAEGSTFVLDEVQYNLLHRITESSDALCLKTADGKVIFAQTPGHKGWLWISKEVTEEKRKTIIQELVSLLKKESLPGITSDPNTAKRFADYFSISNTVEMTMESYYCPKVVKPNNVPGEIQIAARENVETIADYLAGFSRDAFRTPVEPSSQLSQANSMIDSGNLYLWVVDGKPVSMANIAHRSARLARINAVFTPIDQRKNRYASALVAELCATLEKEKLIPALYADISNPASNKVYQNIGFLKSGKIAEIKFLD